jgi:hypothetical protein
MVQNGPAIIWVRSNTRIPSSAAGMDEFPFCCDTLTIGLPYDIL